MTSHYVPWKKLWLKLWWEGSTETRKDPDCNSAQTDNNQKKPHQSAENIMRKKRTKAKTKINNQKHVPLYQNTHWAIHCKFLKQNLIRNINFWGFNRYYCLINRNNGISVLLLETIDSPTMPTKEFDLHFSSIPWRMNWFHKLHKANLTMMDFFTKKKNNYQSLFRQI